MAFAVNSMAYLKLIEKGVNKESLGLLAIPLTPLEIFLPIFISKYTNGPKQLDFFIKSYPYRIIASALIVFWVYVTPLFKDSNNNYPFYYFILCIIINAIHSVTSTMLSVTQTSFFTRICDKKVGGTYMTLLNTISNIGSNWPATLSFYLVDLFTYRACFFDTSKMIKDKYTDKPVNFITLLNKIEENVCSSDLEISVRLFFLNKITNG
jgi:PAT family acetyl-CoA transporter-like MFS transporter 1